MRLFSQSFPIAIAILLFGSVSHATSTSTEVGDAGDVLNPQSITGTGITQIAGVIGATDTADAFKFFYAGGPLGANLALTIPGDGAGGLISLWSESGQCIVGRQSTCPPLDFVAFAPNGSFALPSPSCAGFPGHDNSCEGISLRAGNYILRVNAFPELTTATPYTIDISNPLFGFAVNLCLPELVCPPFPANFPPVGIPAAISAPSVPEPCSLLLVFAGLIASRGLQRRLY